MDSADTELPSFTKLQNAILLAVFKQKSAEPQYQALDSLTEESDRFSRLSEYAIDILRIFRELKLARSLVGRLPPETFFVEHKSPAEDYVMYHQGHFLDLVHQLKDKLTHLVRGLLHEPPFEESDPDPLSLARSKKAADVPGLPDLLLVWTQTPESKHGIAVVLRRRTQYHHFRNRLHLTDAFQDIKLSRAMQKEQTKAMLSEEGQKFVEEKGRAGFDRWHSDLQKKMDKTIYEIQTNIESIGGAMLAHVPLPSPETDTSEIFQKYLAMTESLRIKNVANTEYKQTLFYPIIKTVETSLPLVLGENLLSLYLVGSTSRGDAVRGRSDVNFVLVVRDEMDWLLPIVQELLRGLQRRTSEDIHCTAVSESAFKQNRLLRFTCKTDGLLLRGVDLVGDESFPKPGLELVCMFKENFRAQIDLARKRAFRTPPPNQGEVTFLGRHVAKLGLRLMYWAALADTAKYERNFPGMFRVIQETHPKNKTVTDIFFKLVNDDATVNLESLHHLFEAFDEQIALGSLLDQLDEKCEGLAEQQKKWAKAA
jgi:hypothetical protein